MIKFLGVNTELNILRSMGRQTENVLEDLVPGKNKRLRAMYISFESANGEKASYSWTFVTKVFPREVNL